MSRVFARAVAAVGAAVLLVVITGCSDRKVSAPAVGLSPAPSSSASPPPVASESVPAARAAADQEAVQAYKDMIGTWVEAAKTSNAGSPGLRRYARGQALKVLVDDLYSAKVRKLVAKGTPVSSPVVVDARPVAKPTDVVVQDCFDTTDWLLFKASGKLADDFPSHRRQFKALIRSTDGVWKVDGFVVTGPC